MSKSLVEIIICGLITLGLGQTQPYHPSQMTYYPGLYFDFGTSTPSQCSVPAYYYNTSGSGTLYVCAPPGTMVAAGSGAGSGAGTGSCTNQVVTAVNTSTAPTCNTITSAYVDSSVLSQSDIPTFAICTTAGCAVETTFNNWFVSASSGITFDECGFALQTAPTVQSVIVDIQTAAGVSIFGATKLVIATSASTTTFQSTFANSPQTAAKGAQFKAVITQSDTGGAALGGYVKCRVH